jgi:hypothetical protein
LGMHRGSVQSPGTDRNGLEGVGHRHYDDEWPELVKVEYDRLMSRYRRRVT